MKLANALPEFSHELAEGLIAEGRTDLADSVYTIEIIDRCHCEAPGCIAFHAVPKATAPIWPDECDRIIPTVRGVTCIHFVKSSIVWIEALGRAEEKARLDQLEAVARIDGDLGEQ
jgi:hypothetical protein